MKKGDWHHLCRECEHRRRHPPPPPEHKEPDPPPPELTPLFDRSECPLLPLTLEQRYTLIALYRIGHKKQDIAYEISCSVKTVSHWVGQYEVNHTVADNHRSGRKRITDENTNINIVLTAIEEKFTTPKKNRRELELPASSHSLC